MYRFMILCMASMGELEKAMSLSAMSFVIFGFSVISNHSSTDSALFSLPPSDTRSETS